LIQSNGEDKAQGSDQREIEASEELEPTKGTLELAGLRALGERKPDLAQALARFVDVVAAEAARSSRFAASLHGALRSVEAIGDRAAPARKRSARTTTVGSKSRGNRRPPGPIDPFAVYAGSGDAGLRAALSQLTLEQLRDIVAEHGMDPDRLAMKWKDPSRVIDRILERVASRSTKGSAFRGP
jgi:hypothetical protein